VLLLDEIEKAHQDIYNILLQVMDYARLTDNKGRKADFHNVVLIMTSNAGAQFAGQTVGFSSTVSRGDAMMRQVKRTFKPEFLNRLSGTVVFHDMDRHMAELILQKKLRELGTKLAARQVTMTLADDAFQHLLSQGFTAEYGAREMDRVIAQQLKPLLMREILFGRLKQGGAVTVTHQDGKLVMTVGAKKRAKR
jgi:ATP-dependent Clp protease ATP-binding subunit ClpA